jgi:hypothetical protein
LTKHGTAESVRAFISYAHSDRTHAGQANTLLTNVGISAFLAHEDLEVSDEWQNRLLEELSRCDLFVALFSKNYLASSWAQQESGFIVSRLSRVTVAPVSLDGTRSQGFLSHIQSPMVGPDGITRALLIEPLASRFPRTILPNLIAQASKARSFRRAEELIQPLVRFFTLFTSSEAQAFADGATSNPQIWAAAECRDEYLPAFIRIHRNNVHSESIRRLEYQIEHGTCYRPDAEER